MEKESPSTLYHSLSLAELVVGFLILDSILIWVSTIQKFSLRFLSLIGSDAELITCSSSRIRDEHSTKNTSRSEAGGLEIRREDLEMIMERMGMPSNCEGAQFKESMDYDELSTMFEEKEPSLEEVKESFSVFDENCDGFIDPVELHRVLCKLGFREGVDMDACKLMIAKYDENQDGRIDFNEFVRFMESSFC